MRLLRIAWRNVWRNARRSGVTIGAMALGLLVMILYASLLEGYLVGMERRILELELGDMQIFALDYERDPSVHSRIEDPAAVLVSLSRAGLRAAPRLLAWGLAAVDESSAGASLRGIDVEREREVSRIHEHLLEGRWLRADDAAAVVLGRRLVRTLGASLGDELFVLSQGADGGMAYGLYTVVGILANVGDVTDRTAIFMTDSAYRELMAVSDGAHQIVVRRSEGDELEPVAGDVRTLVPGLDVKTWRQLVPTLASMLDSARSAMIVMFVIVYLAIGILILNAMLMAVFERVREFGILKALGAGPVEVLAMVWLESGIQAGIAIAIGLLLGWPGVVLLERYGIDMGTLAGTSVMGLALDDRWYGIMTPAAFVTPVFALVGIVCLAVAYPAARAAVIRPVDAMRTH